MPDDATREKRRSARSGAPARARKASRPGTSGGKVAALLSERPRTPSQAERLERLRDAARELASEGGYGAVTMRAVARRANVGLATLYRYFSSKDHLIADVHAMRSRDVIADLERDPPRGRSAAQRLVAVFDRMLETTAEDLQLASAGIAALTSSDPAVTPPGYWQKEVMASFLDAALGDEHLSDRETLGELLGHVFFSLMVGLATRRMSLAECKAVIERAVALMLAQP
jgi:AcrR family transcriptional regulator